MFVAVAIYGVAIVVFGLSRDFLLSLVALAVSGGADMVSVVMRQTLVQLETPDDDARARERGERDVHRRQQRAGRVPRRAGRRSGMGPVGAVVVGGVGHARSSSALWMRAFPSLARRDRLIPV